MNDVSFLIPVRGGSKRIPRKNMLEINGETLIARKIRQLAPLGKVYVGSDNDDMLNEAEKHGAIAVRRKMTNEGCDSINDAIKEFVGLIEPCETVAWSHATNPLISTATYNQAYAKFLEMRKDGYDSLISVHEIHGHYWNADGKTPLYNVTWCKNVRHLCANELPPLFEQDGAFFFQPYEQMKRNHYFFGDRPYLYKIPEEEFLDINVPRDVVMLKAILES